MECFIVRGAESPKFLYHSLKSKTFDRFIAFGRLCNIFVPIRKSVPIGLHIGYGEKLRHSLHVLRELLKLKQLKNLEEQI